ncbi:hypothetical protein EBR96_03755 [bacterium]|nr:hypothetical protein [bacterium]
MRKKTEAVNLADKENYLRIVDQTLRSINSLIYELENEVLHNAELRRHSYEIAVDCVPLIKKLNEARRYAEGTLSNYR